MEGTFFDNLAMLLSAAGFFPWWHGIGLKASVAEEQKIQDRCRAQVDRFIGNADTYGMISFERDRLARTSVVVADALRKAVSSASTSHKILNVQIREVPDGSNEMPEDLIETMTALLAGGDDASPGHLVIL